MGHGVPCLSVDPQVTQGIYETVVVSRFLFLEGDSKLTESEDDLQKHTKKKLYFTLMQDLQMPFDTHWEKLLP